MHDEACQKNFSVDAAAALQPWADSLELAVLLDARGTVLAVNRAFGRKFGQPVPAWTGRDFVAMLHPEDAADWSAQSPRLERPPYHISREHRWQTAQGWRWIGWEETALRNAEGEFQGVRAIGRDVTKHRLAEEHFKKLAQAVEQAPVSIVMTTPGGMPQYVNSRFTEVTGYTLEDIFEREIPILREGHANEAAYRQFCVIVASGQKWTGELCTRRKDGGEIWEFVQVSPIRNHLDEIIYLLCLREDITERKILEDQLRQAQKMESLGTLASGIAHDFNNIISIVRGYTELSMAAAPEHPVLARYLGSIHDAALRAGTLVGQILTFSRRSEIASRPVWLNDIVGELIALLSETFPRSIELRRDLDASIESLSADPGQVRQVLMNLCVNARDAMPAGGVLTLRTRRVSGAALTSRKGDPEREYVCISVSDTGTGMTPEVRARIFEPFFTTKQGDGGTGLGLSVAYGVVTNHEGVIELESEPGRGTTFHVYFPLLLRPADTIGAGREVILPPGGERVLVVEDEAPLLALIATVLEQSGYEVKPAKDGVEAIERILDLNNPCDAVVLDLNMPRLGGIEVLKVIRLNHPHMPVIVMSGNITPALRGELLKLNQEVVIEKPFEMARFGLLLRSLLDARKTIETQALS